MNTRMIKARLPAIQNVILLIVGFVLGCFYLVEGIEDHQRAAIAQQANLYAESGRMNEIEAINGRLRGVRPPLEQSCSNAAGFQHPEDSTEHELVRLRRIDACVTGMATSTNH